MSPDFLAREAADRHKRWSVTRRETGAPDREPEYFLREAFGQYQAPRNLWREAKRIFIGLVEQTGKPSPSRPLPF